jgi:glycosyltransferase involved in cell wall biosynthesis
VLELARLAPESGFSAIVGAVVNHRDARPAFIELATEMGLETAVFAGRGRVDPVRCQAIREFARTRSVRVVHCHGYKEDLHALMLSRSVRKVATNHLWKRTSLLDVLYCRLDELFLRRFDVVVGVSEDVTREMRLRGIGQATTIANGVDTDAYQPKERSRGLRQSLGLGEADVVVTMVASLTPEKQHRVALATMRILLPRHPRLRLLVVGQGPMETELRALAATTGLHQRVVFAGGRRDIPDVHAASDVYLLASDREGLPMALLEAMSCGKVAVATGVGEVPAMLSDDRCGFLSRGLDAASIAEAIDRALSLTGEERAVMGRRARARVQGSYSARAMSREYCELYRRVLSGKPHPSNPAHG